MGNQLFSLVFSPDPLRTRLSAFALPFHSPSPPKLCGLFVVLRLHVPHPASRQSTTASWSDCNNLGIVSGALTNKKIRLLETHGCYCCQNLKFKKNIRFQSNIRHTQTQWPLVDAFVSCILEGQKRPLIHEFLCLCVLSLFRLCHCQRGVLVRGLKQSVCG